MGRIAIVGDFRTDNHTHRATIEAIHDLGAESCWISTASIGRETDDVLSGFSGVLVAPGSPYEDMHGALSAISYAREEGVPLLGTCGGFQHVVIEYARNVLSIKDAQHAEYDPYASNLFITPLSCSLVGQEMDVLIAPGTHAGVAYQATTWRERYYCNFGLNPADRETLVSGGLVVSGVDQDDEVRILELPDHPFFIATLFVPQTSSSPEQPHPLLEAFVQMSSGVTADEPDPLHT